MTWGTFIKFLEVIGVVKTSGNQSINGVKTFLNSPIVPTPTTDYQAATKEYVDDEIADIPAVDTSTLIQKDGSNLDPQQEVLAKILEPQTGIDLGALDGYSNRAGYYKNSITEKRISEIESLKARLEELGVSNGMDILDA